MVSRTIDLRSDTVTKPTETMRLAMAKADVDDDVNDEMPNRDEFIDAALVALNVPVDRLVQAADSVSVCLSKGLGAPVGSVIVGTKSFIARARIVRKTLGGGMRQVGILCAAALVALQENVQKLVTDHKNAKTLAEGLTKIKGLSVDVASVETNIVYFEISNGSHMTALKLGKIMNEHGILLMPDSSSRVRIVIHHQVSASDVQYTLACIKQAMTGVPEENGGN
ncbi:hypothetical protein M8C21_004108 [Ambrosia artemisiifolia]|uniref:Aromatic amino acid beta-eliminating lyase/threonine aldolase domain-containing protein n=1 Tax=Ambrosia artemisiifolia TaxID=4212 RepID=A0AAD5GF50_AMBAR|nr:hypothetical protein M8C21_004108 [Ambrosia artemisiifolia]